MEKNIEDGGLPEPNFAEVTLDKKANAEEDGDMPRLEKNGQDAARNASRSVPDGGCLAWSIVIASFMVSFLQDGFRDSFGVLLPTVSEHFQTGRTEAALASSLMTLLTLGSGPLVAFLVQNWGHRLVTIIGVVMSVFGLLIAGLSIQFLDPPSLSVLYISVGLCTGLGFGLMYLPAMDIIELYFDRNLGLALGIAAAGSGTGQLVMAPLIHLVEHHLSLSYTMYILASTVAAALGFAFMYKKPSGDEKKVKVAEDGNAGSEGDMEEVSMPYDPVDGKMVKPKLCSSVRMEFIRVMGEYRRIVTSVPMLILLVHHFLLHCAIFAAFSFTVDRAIAVVPDLTRQDASYLLSIMGIANCLGRVAFGRVLDVWRGHAFLTTTAVVLVNALSVLFSGHLAHSWTGQAVYCGVFGATFGAYISSVVVILKLIDPDNVTTGLGVSLLDFAVASVVGPVIVGRLYDFEHAAALYSVFIADDLEGSGNELALVDDMTSPVPDIPYRTGFLVVGVMGVVGACLLPLVSFTLRKKENAAKLDDEKLES